MSPFAIQLINGFLPTDLEEEDYEKFKKLLEIGAIKRDEDGLYRLTSLYRVGKIFIAEDGKGYLETPKKEEKDLLIEPNNLNGAISGDEVVARRIIGKRGRASAKVVLVIKRAEIIIVAYYDKKSNTLLNIKNDFPIELSSNIDLSKFRDKTVFKVDALKREILEVFGHLDDPRVDEKISLALFNRYDEFPKNVLEEAKKVPNSVSIKDMEGRVDLRELDFCTIDPVSAKDFDDAIYFDLKSHTLYVAIADVSYYVQYYSAIDLEAKKRGFTTYLPHKAFPMLPPILSENICSLVPKEDRLAFVVKIKLDPNTLLPIKEEFFEGVIHSKRRFNYEEIDHFLEGNYIIEDKNEERIFKWLKPLYHITQEIRKKRLKKGFDFKTDEVKLSIDPEHNLKETTIETGTPSHSLIEECMLLANVAAAKRFRGDGDSIFRVHEAPDIEKIEELLKELSIVGIYIEDKFKNPKDIIKAIQQEARKLNIEAEVDAHIIRSLKRAFYSHINLGHFGLGFDKYSHFTSPIRRYSDLILHRIIKSQLRKDNEEMKYLLRNLEPLSVRVSNLERDTTKCEWDFRDRKFARWAQEHIGELFEAEIIEVDIEDVNKGAKAILDCEIDGVVVNLKSYNSKLFDRVVVEISEVKITQGLIFAKELGMAKEGGDV